MPTIADFNQYGNDLERLLVLRTSPGAVKMLEKVEDIPAGTYRPKKDGGVHLAQCQAFALSRRDRVTVAMLKEDHWCPAALIAYGLVKRPAARAGHPYDSFEYGKYIGILTAPLKQAAFTPDVVIIYSNTHIGVSTSPMELHIGIFGQNISEIQLRYRAKRLKPLVKRPRKQMFT